MTLHKHNLCFKLFLFTTVVFLQQASFSAESKKIILNDSITAEEYQLPNGLNVILIPNKKAPSSWVYHWVKAGSLHEKPGVTGIAHLFEHMMFRPLSKKAKPFFDQVKELGGSANANTRYHATVYLTNVPNENLKQLLKLEADRFQKMKVTDDLLNVERKAVWSEYSTKFDSNPFIDLWFHLYQVGFPNHPFGWTVVGSREDLEKINAKDSNDFFAKYYKPNNIGLFVAGDFDSEKIKKIILANYGKWKRGKDSVLPRAFVAPGKITQGLGKLPSQSRNALIGFRFQFWSADKAAEFEIGSYILAGSRFSLNEKRLKDQLKIVSYIEPFNLEYDPGLF
ncbi:MAG: M16 family metallopeptidase, partial [Pseudobdellovibrionaceae bacterium]